MEWKQQQEHKEKSFLLKSSFCCHMQHHRVEFLRLSNVWMLNHILSGSQFFKLTGNSLYFSNIQEQKDIEFFVCHFLKYFYLLLRGLVGFIQKLLTLIFKLNLIFTNSLEILTSGNIMMMCQDDVPFHCVFPKYQQN